MRVFRRSFTSTPRVATDLASVTRTRPSTRGWGYSRRGWAAWKRRRGIEPESPVKSGRMKMKCTWLYAAAMLATVAVGRGQQAEPKSHELIHVDSEGVLRWRTTGTEVAMLGANYCLPSASDYRAAGV